MDEAFADLRVAGASPVEVIRAIHIALGVGLAEAKQIFSESPVWSREVQATQTLHEELNEILAKESGE